MDQLALIRNTRRLILELSEKFSVDELNAIPENFSNNLAWNIGHLVATQQMFCYKLSGLPFTIDETFVDKYKRGSKPEGLISEDEIAKLKSNLITEIDQLERDLKSGVFKTYTPFTTQLGLQLETIDDALNAMIFHEGLHLGYMMAMRKGI